MAIKFKDLNINGTHGPLRVGPPDVRTRRFSIFGVDGVAEIYGLNGGRVITVDIVLHDDFGTSKALIDYVNKVNKKLGDHGTLKETGTISQEFKDCTFESMTPVAFAGQEQPGPIKDVAGLMTDNANPQPNKWIARYMLRFFQLYHRKK